MIAFYISTFIILGIISVSFSKKLFRSFWAPLGVYGIVWSITCSLYLFKIFPLPDPSEKLVAIIFFGWVGFIIGSLIAAFMPIPKRASICYISKSWQKLIIFISLLGFLGSILALRRVLLLFGSEIFYAPWKVRYMVTLSGTAPVGSLAGTYLPIFTFASASLAGVYISRFNFHWAVFLPLIAGIFWSFAILGRWQLLYIILLYGFGYFLGNRLSKERKGFGSLITIAVIGLSFIVLMSLFSGRSGFWLSKVARVKLPSLLLGFIERLVLPLYYLDQILHKSSPLEWGINLANPFYQLIGRIFGQYTRPYPEFYTAVNPFTPQWGENFIPPTYFAHIYWDFGNIGLFTIPILFGLVSSVLFKRHTFTSTFVLTFLYVALVRSFANWVFWYPPFTGAMIFTLISSRIILRRACVSKLEAQMLSSSLCAYPSTRFHKQNKRPRR